MKVAFSPSEFSVGMEMEFQLVDVNTHALVDGVLPCLDALEGVPNIKAEFIQNTIEVASDPCADVASLENNMRGYLKTLLPIATELDMALCGAGTHPFSTKLASITPYPRYVAMEKRFGLIGHTQNTFATHVHVGVESGDEAVRLMSEMKPYLPVLIALSANSPYWRGLDTEFAAYRQRILSASRSYGLPPEFTDWRDFEQFLGIALRSGTFDSIHDIHWDIRPRPHFGTVEVRIMDAQPTVQGAAALATFIRALVLYLRSMRQEAQHTRILQPLAEWAVKDNCYNASRMGLGAKVIVNNEGTVSPLIDIVSKLMPLLLNRAPNKDERERFDCLNVLIDQPTYQRQLDIGANKGLPAIVAEFSRTLNREVQS